MRRLSLMALLLLSLLAAPAAAQVPYEAEVRFPSQGDDFVLALPPTVGRAGDTMLGVRTLPLARVDDVDIRLVLQQNRLQERDECALELDVAINDVPFGTVILQPGELTADAFLQAPEDVLGEVVGEEFTYSLLLSVAADQPEDCGFVEPVLGRSIWHMEIEDPPGNARPRAAIPQEYSVLEGQTVEVEVVASDPEETELTIGWDLDGDEDFGDAEGSTAVFDATALDGPAEHNFWVRVEDEGGAVRIVEGLVTVENVPPAFDEEVLPETIAAQDVLYTFAPQAIEPSPLDELTYTLLRRPQGMTVDEASGVVQWTPGEADVDAMFTIRLKVEDDDGGADVLEWDVQVVMDPNVPWVHAGEDRAVDPGCLEITCAGNDPRGRPLRYHWEMVRGPEDAVFADPDQQTATVVVSLAGDYTFSCVATEDVPDEEDPLTSPPDTVVITVNNLPPVADPGFSVYGKVRQRVTLDGRRSMDPNGDGLRFRWEQVRGANVRISGITNPITSFYPEETDIYCFTLSAQDGGGAESEPAEVCVVVDEPGDPARCLEDRDCRQDRCIPVAGEEFGRCDPFTDPDTNPVASAGEDQWALVGDLVTLRGMRSYDPDSGQPFLEDYIWRQTCGPVDVDLEDLGTPAPHFTAGSAGRYCFTVEVVDGDSHHSLPDEVQVVVESPDNKAPRAEAGEGHAVHLGDQVTLDASGSWDPDGDELTYQWLQLRGNPAPLDNPAGVQASFCAAVPGIYQFQLIVSDGDVEGLPAEVWVTVTHPSNDAPVAKAGTTFIVQTDDGDPENLASRAVLDGRQSFDPDAPEWLRDPQKYLKFQWIQTGGLPVDLQLPFTRRPWFRTRRWGLYTFRLFALDSWPEVDDDEPGFVAPAEDWLPAWSLPSDVTIVVNDVPGAAGNSVPAADAGRDVDCLLGEDCYLDGTRSTDADGDELRFAWLQLRGVPVGLQDADTARPYFPADELGEWRFELKVSDPYVTSLPDVVLVRIRSNDNVAPICRAGRDTDVRPGTEVVLNGCGSLDANGDELVYTWTQVAGPDVDLTLGEDLDACKAYFTVPGDVAPNSEFTFELIANDGRTDCEPSQVTIQAVVAQVCDPEGEAVVCQCAAGGRGHRRCQDDGLGWTDCEDCQIPPVCVAGETRSCRCDGDAWGDQTCAEDGSGYSECANCTGGGEGEGEGEGGGGDEGCSVAGGPGAVHLLWALGLSMMALALRR